MRLFSNRESIARGEVSILAIAETLAAMALVFYTIACVGYLTLNDAHGWHWPKLGEKWLPW